MQLSAHSVRRLAVQDWVDSPEAILDFWFGDSLRFPGSVTERVQLWFTANAEFDRKIRDRFSSLPERALRGELDAWSRRSESALALVLILDQFPRNLFRGSARAFEFDPKALETAAEAVDAGLDEELAPLQASFLYLPFEHSEDPTNQERSVQLFERLVRRAPPELASTLEQAADYARRHRDVVQRFGRFPHRNGVLGRQSTPEEAAYLESGGETFSAGGAA